MTIVTGLHLAVMCATTTMSSRRWVYFIVALGQATRSPPLYPAHATMSMMNQYQYNIVTFVVRTVVQPQSIYIQPSTVVSHTGKDVCEDTRTWALHGYG